MGQKKIEYHKKAIEELNPAIFTFYPSHPIQHLEIKDKRGITLVYRLRIPPLLTQTLQDSERLIPMAKKTRHDRGESINRHWALWKKYNSEPRYSAEYLKDKDNGTDAWFKENKSLFEYLSDMALRNINPQMYAKFKSINKTVSSIKPSNKEIPPFKPLCGVWFGCAINQNQTSDGEPHIDTSDYPFGYNVVTGWGQFSSSHLLLWQLEKSIEIQPGDAVLFFG